MALGNNLIELWKATTSLQPQLSLLLKMLKDLSSPHPILQAKFAAFVVVDSPSFWLMLNHRAIATQTLLSTSRTYLFAFLNYNL